jgi:phospholipase/carboxylesterase
MHAPVLETIVVETAQSITSAVIWLHGLGADGYDFAGIPSQLNLPSDVGVRFIFPHAPVRPVTLNNGYSMRAWYDIYSLTNLRQEDPSGIHASQQAIQQLIEQQRNDHIPATRIILAGFSQGGAIALHTGLHYPDQLGGILGLSTYLPLMAQFPNGADTKNLATTPVFLGHGDQDDLVPFLLGEETRDVLLQAGCQVEWHSYPIAHQVSIPEIADIGRWLTQRLMTAAT